MIITEYHKKVFNAEICPYCKSSTVLKTETDIYGKEYSGRGVFACSNYPKCDAYVGCHADGKPLGRLADKTLRNAKIEAHSYFDKLWQEKKMKRSECYRQLSEDLNIEPEFTHIGLFGLKTLKKVILWSKVKYTELI